MNVLIIAAHPDDEVLGCGGTIARMAEAGDHVTIAILGEGATSRSDTREEADSAETEALMEQSRAAAKLLGAKDVRFFGLPDNRFDTVPMLDVVKAIEGLVDELRPEAVYTQSGGDLNVDHQVTFQATMTALRPMQGEPVRELYAYEVPSSSEWAFGQFEPRFNPGLFVDVDKTLGTKIEAMAVYDGESRPYPHPRSPEALEALARARGTQAGMNAAEAFAVIWLRR